MRDKSATPIKPASFPNEAGTSSGKDLLPTKSDSSRIDSLIGSIRISPAAITPPPITILAGSSAASSAAQSAPIHLPVVLKAAIATESPDLAASVRFSPVSPSIVPFQRANSARLNSGDAAIASRAWRISALPDAYCS